MLTIIDYKAGNVRSIQNMLRKIGYKSIISNKVDDIKAADKLILPGVGAFDYGMEQLEKSKLIPILNEQVLIKKIPILGICLGVQLFTLGSDEGKTTGLAWLDAKTVSFDKIQLPDSFKIPSMGWNNVNYNKSCKLFHNMPNDTRFYFVHSYHLETTKKQDVIVTANYGYEFVAGLEHENIVGVQFHPEKSHKFGMQLLRNFIEKY